MKKFLVGTAIGLVAVIGAAPAASAAPMGQGHAYGAVVQQCLSMSVGDAIKAGKEAHPGVGMNAKSIATSPHCAA
jgi:predicted metal-dependent TIM-barrel fold hydrolase